LIDCPKYIYAQMMTFITETFLTSIPSNNLASVKIVDSVAVGVEDSKARGLVVVLVRVPEHVDLVEGLAGNGTPVSLGVLDGSDLYDDQ
jgi:hypothetical protein